MSLIAKIIHYKYRLLKNILHLSFLITTTLLFLSYYSTYLHPQTFILLPFLALSFPVFLIVNLFWILFFAISLQFKRLLIALGILLFFIPQLKTFYNIHWAKNIKPSKHTLSVLSFNVKLFDLYNWQDNNITRKKIFQYLQQHPADIMCFQEFYTSEDTNDFNNLEELKKLFPNYYFHQEYFVTLRKNDHWGLLTMSKYPILKKSVIHFNTSKNNGCLYSDILFGQDTIRIFNLHLQSYSLYKKKKWKPHQKANNENFFEALDTSAKGFNLIEKIYYNNILKTQQIESILKITSTTYYPTLLVGDFNDLPHTYLMRQIKKAGFTDAFVEQGNGFGITYHDKILLRIDYIFADKNFQILDFITENNPQTQYISDHYPIRCLLELKTN